MMALYKVPGVDALNGTLPLSAPIIPNEGHAKYVCLDPWVNDPGIFWDNSSFPNG